MFENDRPSKGRTQRDSSESASYTDSVSKDPYRDNQETRLDQRGHRLGRLRTGLTCREPMFGRFQDPKMLDFLGGPNGRR